VDLRVRVQASRLVVGEAVAAAIEDVVGRPVVADSTDPTQAHKASRPPDVVVVIGNASDASQTAAIRTARRRWRQAFVIALAESDRVEDGVALVRHGADTWLTRSEGLDALRSMLVRIGAGERVVLPPTALGYIASSLGHAVDGAAVATARLTSRESQVLDCFALGMARHEIAARLSISRATLRTHVQNILHKLNLHSIDEAVSLAALEAHPTVLHDA
jgi:DNA-binding NarL/FixJ family response regulator